MTNAKTLIALHGCKGCGKSTAANMLGKYLGLPQFAFATKLKAICSVMFGVPVETFDDVSLKEVVIPEHKLSPRTMMTRTGGIIKTFYGQDFFAKELHRAYAASKDGLIVTDLRFPMEMEVVRDLGGTVVCVRRSESPYSDFSDVSELPLPMADIDHMLDNFGTPTDLVLKVRELITFIGRGDALRAFPHVPTDAIEFGFR